MAPQKNPHRLLDHPGLARLVDRVRRRVEQVTLGHRGRTHDPLHRIRKLLGTAA